MVTKRYLSEENLQRMKKDFKFLLKHVQDSYGELDLALRETIVFKLKLLIIKGGII